RSAAPGTGIDAAVACGRLCTISLPGSALPDGAVVIQKGRIAAAGCLFPLTENPNVARVLGTRHRAAIGLTEETDAIVLVVSEETGTVSFVNRGVIERPIDIERLRMLLLEYYAQLEDVELARSAVLLPDEADAVAKGRK